MPCGAETLEDPSRRSSRCSYESLTCLRGDGRRTSSAPPLTGDSLVLIQMRARKALWVVPIIFGATALLLKTSPATTAQPSVNFLRVPGSGIQPQIVEKDGVVHILYFSGDPKNGDLNYVVSRDHGRTFSKAIRVNSEPGTAMATGNIRGGQMAIGANGQIHVAWIGSSTALPRAGSNSAPVFYASLSDTKDRFETSKHVNQTSWGADGATVAADARGDVFVFWHAQPPQGKDEASRRLWIARSGDGGKSFADERVAYSEPTGVCGCCGSRAFADAEDTVYVLFRASTQVIHRDMYLLTSLDRGQTFRGADIARWDIGACVMSSASLIQSGRDVVAAWEAEKQVYFGLVDHRTHNVSGITGAPGSGNNRKYPAVATNGNGLTLLVWTENMAWGKGGSVVWQSYDRTLQPEGLHGQTAGVPAWSLVAVFARPDGNFTIMY
jgi:hypothetical protein